jgi:hypothetical protein
MCVKITTLICLIISSLTIAQSNAKSSANVSVKVIQGTSFNITKNNFNFKQVLNEKSCDLKSEPNNGISLSIDGAKIGELIINFENSKISRVSNNELIYNNLKQLEESFLLKPIIEVSDTYTERRTQVKNGFLYNVNKELRSKNLSLMIGGYLQLPDSLKDGFYTGAFVLSLIYR